jgi:hypothetical protein
MMTGKLLHLVTDRADVTATSSGDPWDAIDLALCRRLAFAGVDWVREAAVWAGVSAQSAHDWAHVTAETVPDEDDE